MGLTPTCGGTKMSESPVSVVSIPPSAASAVSPPSRSSSRSSSSSSPPQSAFPSSIVAYSTTGALVGSEIASFAEDPPKLSLNMSVSLVI